MKIWILIVCCLVVSVVKGQDLRTYQLNEVVVKGKRSVKESAVTKTVIDSAEFAESGNGSMADLLSKHTPVFIKTYGQGSLATVSFRGTAASHTQVEWNGININNPMLGQVDFSLIPVWFVDRTELYHGGSSLQQGSGALGGSIALGSAPDWGKKIFGSVLQGIGSFGTYQTFVSAGGGGKRVQAKVRYLYEQAENDFTFLNTAIRPIENVKQRNADYRKNGAVADLFWNAGKGHFFSVNAWFQVADRNLPTIMSYEGLGREEKQKDEELRIVGKWGKYTDKIRSEWISGFTTTSVDYYLANMTNMGNVLNYDSRSSIYSWYNKYKFDYDITKRMSVRALLNGNHHKVEIMDHITKEGYDATRSEFGLSLSLHYRFSNTFSGFLLAREDLVDKEFTSFMPSVGLEITPFKTVGLSLKLNGTRNYHQPTLNDLYWLPGGNPALKPEQGYTTDASLEYVKKWNAFSLTASATGYMSWIDDWIIWRPSEFRYWTAENVKEVFARGTEMNIQLGYQAGGFKTVLRGNYGFTRTTNQNPKQDGDQSKGKQLIYIPVHKANLMLDAGWKGYYLYYTWGYTGERFTTSSNETTRHMLPGYDLHNLMVGKQLYFAKIGLDLQLKINNLLSKDYQAILWRAMPKRNYTFLVKFSF